MKFLLYCLLYFTSISACSSANSSKEVKVISYTIMQEKMHNPQYFTQGLILNNGVITETSGLYGKSLITQYYEKDNAVIRSVPLPNSIFAEGVTHFNDDLYVLSWKSEKVFILNPQSLETTQTLKYQGEGWGITHNNEHIITSNGSHKISYRNAMDFSVIKTINIHHGEKEYDNINELEYAKGIIWANVWQSSYILAIQPETGRVLGKIDLEALVKVNHTIPQTSVLNGIAYDKVKDAFWITGKLWPKRYLIKLSWP